MVKLEISPLSDTWQFFFELEAHTLNEIPPPRIPVHDKGFDYILQVFAVDKT